MKISSQLIVAAAVWVFTISMGWAQIWQTVDLSGELFSLRYAHRIAVSAAGEVYVLGREYEFTDTNTLSTGVNRVLVHRSLDEGQNWQTVGRLGDFGNPGSGTLSLRSVGGISFAPEGQVHFAYTLQPPSREEYWLTRTSLDQGATWSVTDQYAEPGNPVEVRDVVAGPSNLIHVVGSVPSASVSIVRRSGDGGLTWTNLARRTEIWTPNAFLAAPGALFVTGIRGSTWLWVVLRSVDGGTTWQQVDQYQKTSNHSAQPRRMAIDARGNLFVVGTEYDKAAPVWTWTVRRSANGGSTWTTVDQFTGDAGADAYSVSCTPDGRVYVAGLRVVVPGRHVWHVRVSHDGGSTWSRADEFGDGTTVRAEAYDVAASPAGDIYVVGVTYQRETVPRIRSRAVWLVRKLPALGPALSVSVEGTQCHVSWLASASGFVLQCATTLVNGGDWTDLGAVPDLVDGWNAVTLEALGEVRFFRLRRPGE